MDSFGSRLRYERERRQIALKSIAESTKIGITLLEGLERDDVSRWPSGIFRKSFIRSYADAIGLDAEGIVREFVERHPDPLEADITAPPAAARPPQTSHGTPPQVTAPPSSARPLAIKLTITWSGSVRHTISRFVEDSHIRRFIGWLKSFNLPIFHSANLPLANSPTQHVSGVAGRDQVPPA